MQFQQLKILPHALTKTIFPKLLHHLASQHLQNDREHGKNKEFYSHLQGVKPPHHTPSYFLRQNVSTLLPVVVKHSDKSNLGIKS